MLSDTSPRARARYVELLRGQSPRERLERVVELTRVARELCATGIRGRHPSASEEEIRVRLAVRLSGRDLAARWFGAVPDDAV